MRNKIYYHTIAVDVCNGRMRPGRKEIWQGNAILADQLDISQPVVEMENG